jgi:hypothetical protein
VIALSVVVTGCSGGSSHKTTSSPGTGSGSVSSSAGSSDGGKSAADKAIAQVMGSTENLPALASSKGKLKTSSSTSPVVAEVLQVKNSSEATRVTWRLKSASGSSVDTKSFQFARPPLFDTRLLGVVDPASKKTYHPYTYIPASGDGSDTSCVCSDLPDSVNAKGAELYAVLPPLPSGVTTVNVTLPGFKAMTGVKVTS